MSRIELQSINKTYGKVHGVRDINISIEDGEFLALLGPSGSGKTTILRMIAGLDDPTSGEILINGAVVNRLPPWKRDCGFVFQKYALFPHMTVKSNIGYGLRIRKKHAAEIDQRILEVADKLQIKLLLDRYPNQLSAGQQQRVALARALAIHPTVLLMDEPLANLDARLRARVRFELKAIQRDLGITTIYVSHDQDEAFALGDRVTVLNDGRIEQVGSPSEIYEHPKTAFIAYFIGNNNNVIKGKVMGVENGRIKVRIGEWLLETKAPGVNFSLELDATVIIRPEMIKICKPGASGTNIARGSVSVRTMLGSSLRMLVDIGAPLEVLLPGMEGSQLGQVGDTVTLMLENPLIFPGLPGPWFTN